MVLLDQRELCEQIRFLRIVTYLVDEVRDKDVEPGELNESAAPDTFSAFPRLTRYIADVSVPSVQ